MVSDRMATQNVIGRIMMGSRNAWGVFEDAAEAGRMVENVSRRFLARAFAPT